jgi:hypothetical protein
MGVKHCNPIFRGAGDLVHLVFWFISFVWFGARNTPDQLDKLDELAWPPLTQRSSIASDVMDMPATLQ